MGEETRADQIQIRNKLFSFACCINLSRLSGCLKSRRAQKVLAKVFNSLVISFNLRFSYGCSVLWSIKPHHDPLGNLEVSWAPLVWRGYFGLNPSVNWWESALSLFVFVNVLCMSVLVCFCLIWMEVTRGDGGRPLGTLSCPDSLTFVEDKCEGRRHSWQLLLFESIYKRAWVKANCSRWLKRPCFFATLYFFSVKDYANKDYMNLKSCHAKSSWLTPLV